MIIVIAAALAARAAYVLRQHGRTWSDLLIGRKSYTAFTVNAALRGFGILLTASGLPIHPHYMIVAFPLPFVWLARLALGRPERQAGALTFGRALLVVLCLSQFLVSACFLGYIHLNQGASHAEYGDIYAAQRAPIHPPRNY